LDPILFIVFLPLLAAIIGGLGNRMLGNTVVKSLTTGALFISCILSWPIFLHFISGSAEAHVVPVMKWVQSGSLSFDWALRTDALTAVMLVVITTVSALVHLYSWGYMEEDPDQPRFFAYLSLFTFAMLMLVTADNLVQMFFGWEGVGLASYLLIGFWFRKPSANAAAIRPSWSTASATSASCSASSAPSWFSAPSRSLPSSKPRRAWPGRRSASSATASIR
jgi:NADH-quinone oxidoreductase subunit L